jgi:rfaE bifunctional protein nucleotidyltransferase chain/domain/rfaE bifunctional protein kinase chain/domain
VTGQQVGGRPVRLVVVGDVLLDRDVEGDAGRLCPDAPVPVVDWDHDRERPGGAGLTALVAARQGAHVTLVTALGDDPAAGVVRRLLASGGVRLCALPTTGTTAEKTRVRAAGQTLLRIDRGRPGMVTVDEAAAEGVGAVLDAADAVLVSDYAGGVAATDRLRALLAGAATRTPLVWDPHPRGSEPVPGAWLVTPNLREALTGAGEGDDGVTELAGAARAAGRLRDRWGARAVAVTLGARGALLVTGDGPPLVSPCAEPANGDVSGAGDAFAAGAALALGTGAVHSEAVAAGVARGARFVGGLHATTWFVDERPAPATPAPRPDGSDDPAAALIERVRAAGGTVVMTGGCFDLLHRGHVQLLRDARALGDCLVVCLNADESVRRLKGPARPVVTAEDRARVVRALGCVDEVVIFSEDTPVEILRRYRPHLFVKGGDYGGAELPEVPVLAEWGGQVVVVPYVDGHSTSRILQEVVHGQS